MRITSKGIEFDEEDFVKDPKPTKKARISDCPRCGDRMLARELDFVCNECGITVDKV